MYTSLPPLAERLFLVFLGIILIKNSVNNGIQLVPHFIKSVSLRGPSCTWSLIACCSLLLQLG